MTIKSEIQALMHGRELTDVRDIEAWAKNAPDSSLHKNLKYDDEAGAAHEWRLSEIRKFIRIYIVDTRGLPATISLTVDRGAGGYRHMQPTLEMPNLRDIAVMDLLKKLQQIRDTHDELGFDEFAPVWDAIDEVAGGLNPRPRPTAQPPQPGISP